MLIETSQVIEIKLPNVILLAQTPEGNTVAISRRDEYTQLGLPGGKVEIGETAIEALLREIKEELNVDLNQDHIEWLYEAKEGDTQTITFKYSLPIDVTQLAVINTENCFITALPLENLTNQTVSPFWEYNQGLVNFINEKEKQNG